MLAVEVHTRVHAYTCPHAYAHDGKCSKRSECNNVEAREPALAGGFAALQASSVCKSSTRSWRLSTTSTCPYKR